MAATAQVEMVNALDVKSSGSSESPLEAQQALVNKSGLALPSLAAADCRTIAVYGRVRKALDRIFRRARHHGLR
jgi:peroxiredoxin